MTIEIPEQFSPNKLYVCTQDGHVARMPTNGGDPVDISPTSEQQESIGDVIRMVVDPFNSKRAVILGTTGVCYTLDITKSSPTWAYKTFTGGGTTYTETLVTFDPGGWAAYTPLFDTYISDSGEPSANIAITTTQHTAPVSGDVRYWAVVRVELPGTTHVSTVQWTGVIPGYTQVASTGHNLIVYDAANNIIYQDDFGDARYLAPHSTQDYWLNPEIDNARSVEVWYRLTGFFGEYWPLLDNIHIYHSPISSYVGGTPFGDMQAALNRKNTYYWLSKATENSIDYVYFNRTFDFFETVQSTRVARYSDSMVYGIAPSPFTQNSSSAGTIWVTAGEPGQDAAVYEIADWDEDPTPRSEITIGSGGGAILMPWSLPTGRDGATIVNLIALENVEVENGNLHTSGLNGVTTIVNGVGGPISNAALNAYMFDGAYLSAAVKNGTIWNLITSNDGGENWAINALPSGYEARSLTGIGASPDYLVLAGDGTLAITPDGGENWQDLWSSFQGWADVTWKDAQEVPNWDPTLVSALIGLPSRPTHDGRGFCPLCYIEALLALLLGNPISAQDGDKYEEATDLSLNTPAGPLTFTRTYRQSKQADYAFMGLGWTHNQRLALTEIAGTPNRIVIQMPNAGEVHFTETETSGTYEGDPGSASTLVWNGTTGQYTLTTSDKSTFVFEDVDNDGVFELVSRAWANGETWTYSYTDGLLSVVDDGYGRQLVFRYYAGGVFNDLLYRVGDHTFDDSDPDNPLGRYVEYSYTLNKVVDANGAIVDGSAGLLTGVQDVRGQVTTYVYYGQAVGETDVRQLNFLVKRQSPQVDTRGDGVADTILTPESLTYTLQGTELAVNGGMEADSDWADVPGAAPTTNERSTVQVDSGNYSRHVETDQGGQGIQGNAWGLIAGRTYILTARVYPVSGVVKMHVSGETTFDRLSSGQGVWQTLRAVYQPGSAATGKKIQFIADGSTAEFYVDSVSLIESDLSMSQIVQERGLQDTELAINGGMEVDSDWADIPGAAPTTNGRSTAQVDSGSYSRHVVAAQGGQGIQGNAWNLIAGRTYTLTARVYPVSGAVKMHVTGEAAFDQLSSGSGAWITLSAVYIPTSGATGRRLQFIANGSAAEFYVDSVSIIESASALLQTTFAFQPGSEGITTETTAGKANTYFFFDGMYQGAEDPAGNRQMQAVGFNYRPEIRRDANGSPTLMQWSPDGKQLSQVRDALGYRTAFSYNQGGATDSTLKDSIAAEGRRTIYIYHSLRRQPSIALVTDGDDLAINGGMEANSDWESVGTPLSNQRSTGQVDTGSYARYVDADAAGEGIQGNPWNLVANRSYAVIARVYPVSGQVKMTVTNTTAFDQVTSGTGAWQTLRAVVKASSNLNNVHLQFVSEGGAAQFYVDTVYIIDGAPILRWQEFAYDSRGRTLAEQTLDPSDGMTVQQEVTRSYYTSGNGNGLLHTVTQTDIGGENDVSTTYTYDSGGRVVKTQQNSNFGGCTISYTVYDVAGNVVATICNYDPGSSADPTTAAEAVALFNENFPDKNQVTTHEYDALGRRFKSTTHAGASYAQTTLTVYDALDRVARTIANYVADAAITDPFVHDRSDFDHGADNTQNLIIDTVYNERGMVRQSVDVLGNVTLYGYDDAGRLVKTVQSASQPNYDNTYETGGDPTLADYTPGTDPDEDLITSQSYDPAGNLVKAVDVLGNVIFTVYDALNRPVKTVRYAKDGATISLNPGDTGYDAANDPRSDDYVPDEAPDRDLIDRSEYDSMGRVRRTQDTLGNWTLYGYDALGRQVKTIRNAATPDYDMASDPALTGYSLDNAVDQDIITQTAYDSSGRVMYIVDVQGERTWSKYDGLGRQIKAITNAIGTATDGSANDPRSDSYVPDQAPDQDLISLTHYDSDGRVQWTQDPVNRKTWYVYDSLGRQVKMIRNCSYISGTPAPEDESYVGSTDPDKDLITRTVYDAQGRVWKTIDDRGNETRYTYDVLGRQSQVTTNYVDGIYNADYPDEDLTTTISYDLAGRVVSTVDAAGNEIRYTYDAVGRRVQTIANYVDGVYSASAPDEDLITATTFNRAGQVVSTTDVRGTQTAFVYDVAGRTRQVTQAAGTSLVTTGYTCYDKGGHTLRAIRNYRPQTGDPSPDVRDTGGNWLFDPAAHGLANDENLITTYTLDKVGRQVTVSDPLGNTAQTTYFKAGGVESVTDPENAVSQYRYDRLRRRLTVVQGYAANGDDPANWVWDATDGRWEQSNGTAITFGDHNDRNVIAQAEYDKAGRMVALREPRGKSTTYTYDLLDRRTSLTNPLSQTWATAFSDLPDGKARLTLTDPLSHQTQQDFDRLGRLYSLAYLDETPKLTPDVTFAYNAAGVRTHMDETADGGTTFVRKTAFSYDKARRLTGVDFDTNGDGTVEQSVTYEYDAGGLRTQLTLPGSRDIVYAYNAKGQLVSLTDWDDQTTQYTYDQVGRQVTAVHANGLLHQYQYDPAGRMTLLRHSKDSQLLGQFAYQVDGRGNRTLVDEVVQRATVGPTTFAYNDYALYAYRGTWTNSAPFKTSTNFGARLRLSFRGMGEATLRMGVGPDHSIYDVYVDGALWQSFNGYADSAGAVALSLPLEDEVPHRLEIRNRPEKDKRSTGYTIRFHSLTIPASAPQFDLQTVEYTYDTLSRLIAADSYPGALAARHYGYTYDLAGNRTQQAVTLGTGTPTVTNYTYNAINQITSGGAQYDAAGRMTSDGVNTYAWDRANRLLRYNHPDDNPNLPNGYTVYYTYNGLGQRVHQEFTNQLATQYPTDYLLDIQPGLWQVLMSTEQLGQVNTNYYIHGPHGLQQQQKPNNAWVYPVQDGLGSVRSVVDMDMNVLESLHYAPYGDPWGLTGTPQTDFGFTGEPTGLGGLIHLRARYYNPALGVFTARDPLERNLAQPTALNRYGYVQGNVINAADPSGLDPSCDASALGIALDGFCPFVKILEETNNACKAGACDMSRLKDALNSLIGASIMSGDPIGLGTLESISLLITLFDSRGLNTAVDIAHMAIRATSRTLPSIIPPGVCAGLGVLGPDCTNIPPGGIPGRTEGVVTAPPVESPPITLPGDLDALRRLVERIISGCISIARVVSAISGAVAKEAEKEKKADPMRLHIALGVNEYLFAFAYQLDQRFQSENIKVYPYGDWIVAGLVRARHGMLSRAC